VAAVRRDRHLGGFAGRSTVHRLGATDETCIGEHPILGAARCCLGRARHRGAGCGADPGHRVVLGAVARPRRSSADRSRTCPVGGRDPGPDTEAGVDIGPAAVSGRGRGGPVPPECCRPRMGSCANRDTPGGGGNLGGHAAVRHPSRVRMADGRRGGEVGDGRICALGDLGVRGRDHHRHALCSAAGAAVHGFQHLLRAGAADQTRPGGCRCRGRRGRTTDAVDRTQPGPNTNSSANRKRSAHRCSRTQRGSGPLLPPSRLHRSHRRHPPGWWCRWAAWPDRSAWGCRPAPGRW